MRLDAERARGNIDYSTDIVGIGEFVAYAEADYGPWTVEFERGNEGGKYSPGHDAQFTVKGPYIGEGLRNETNLVVNEKTHGDITDTIDVWDYVEAAGEEIYSEGDN